MSTDEIKLKLVKIDAEIEYLDQIIRRIKVLNVQYKLAETRLIAHTSRICDQSFADEGERIDHYTRERLLIENFSNITNKRQQFSDTVNMGQVRARYSQLSDERNGLLILRARINSSRVIDCMCINSTHGLEPRITFTVYKSGDNYVDNDDNEYQLLTPESSVYTGVRVYTNDTNKTVVCMVMFKFTDGKLFATCSEIIPEYLESSHTHESK